MNAISSGAMLNRTTARKIATTNKMHPMPSWTSVCFFSSSVTFAPKES